MSLSSEISNEYIRPFVQSNYDNWKAKIVEEESKKTQTLDKTTHSNYTTPYSYTTHSDNGKHSNYTPHSDRSSSHSNGHYNNANDTYWHEDGKGHSNAGTTHVNDSKMYVYNTTDSNGKHVQQYGHGNYSTGGGYHPNIIHCNRYHPTHGNTGHTNYTPHSNSSSSHSNSHTNYSNHSNGYYHTNDGFSHSNYIPSVPYLYELEETVKRVYGATTIRMFSYDSNEYGNGSQFNYSKNVLYKIEIRQIKKLDGTAKTSSWVVLKDYDINSSYTLNTIDPLKTGNTVASNTEGYYEIRVTPRNEAHTENGVSRTYIGVPKTVAVKIEQNNIPQITVKNANEFINFTFGQTAAKSSSGSVIEYGNLLFKDAPKDNVQGIFLSIDVSDKDINNYVKGKVYLLDASGSKITSDNNIIWSNGKEVTKTNGTNQNGIVFINKEQYLKNKELKNCKVEIVLTDYLNEDCSVIAGEVILQRTVSGLDKRDMVLNIDNIAPNVVLTQSTTIWSPTVTIGVNASDNSGIKYIKYPDERIISSVNTGSFVVNKNGSYLFEVSDVLGNITKKSINIYNVDGKAPTVMFIPGTISKWSNKPVDMSWTLTDADSGVKRWRSRVVIEDKDGNKTIGSWGSYFETVYGAFNVATQGKVTIEIEAEDKAGNKGITKSPVVLIDTEAPKGTLNLDTFISNNYTYVPLKMTALSDNLSGIKSIKASFNADFSDAVEITNVTQSSIDIHIPRKDKIEDTTVYVKIEDNAGNVYTTSKKTFIEPYPPNKPQVKSPINDILIVRDEPLYFDFVYSDPANFKLIKTELIFKNRDTNKVETLEYIGDATYFKVSSLLDKGIYDVNIKVWNSKNKFTLSDTIVVRKEKYKLTGNVLTKEIGGNGSLIKFLKIDLDKDFETKLNANKQKISSSISMEIILPDANGNFSNAGSKIALTEKQIDGKEYIRIPDGTYKMKVNIIMKSPDIDLTPILDAISILAK